jgi:hypothetical protein
MRFDQESESRKQAVQIAIWLDPSPECEDIYEGASGGASHGARPSSPRQGA